MFNKKLVVLVIMLLFGGHVYACMSPHEGERRAQRQEPVGLDHPWRYHLPPPPDWVEENEDRQSLVTNNQMDINNLLQAIQSQVSKKPQKGDSK